MYEPDLFWKPTKLLVKNDIISKCNIVHLTDLKIPKLVASSYKGLDGKLPFEHQRNIRLARDDILKDYNKGNNNWNLFTYLHSIYNAFIIVKQGKWAAEEIVRGLLWWLSQWLSHHVILLNVARHVSTHCA